MNDRRAKRQAKARRRRLIRRILLIGVPAILLVAVAAVVVASVLPKLQSDQPEQPQVPATETVIELAFAGDLNITDKVVAAGMTDSGYDYSGVLKDVLPLLADADQTILNFEGNLCGAPYGSKTASAPAEILSALSDAGVDLLQVANSCTIKNGLLGLEDTLNSIRFADFKVVSGFC